MLFLTNNDETINFAFQVHLSYSNQSDVYAESKSNMYVFVSAVNQKKKIIINCTFVLELIAINST